jgi:pilus assembly protein CpaC
MVRTLAEPNLTALSGQEASFLAGGEYPVPVVDGDGGVTIDYKPFGVELSFTPRVVDGDIINLELSPPSRASTRRSWSRTRASRSTASAAARRDHGRDARRRELRDRGSLEDDFRDLVGQVPWLGDIPILGRCSAARNTSAGSRNS